jgi:hypothetical protein
MFLHAKHENEHFLQLKKIYFNGVLNYNVLPMGTPKDVVKGVLVQTFSSCLLKAMCSLL